jgi:hypothetical protein
MRTPLEQLEAIERLRSILTVRQFGSIVGIETTAAGDKVDRLLDLTPDQIDAEFGSSGAFRELIRREIADQRDVAFRRECAPPAQPAHPAEQPVAPFVQDDDASDRADEARIAEALAEAEERTAEAEQADLLADNSVFEDIEFEPLIKP